MGAVRSDDDRCGKGGGGGQGIRWSHTAGDCPPHPRLQEGARGRACPHEEGVRAGDALEGKAPQRRPQRLLDRGLAEVAKGVGGGHCRLQMPLKLAQADSGWA